MMSIMTSNCRGQANCKFLISVGLVQVNCSCGLSGRVLDCCLSTTCSLSLHLHEDYTKAYSGANGLQTTCRHAASARVSNPPTPRTRTLTRCTLAAAACTRWALRHLSPDHLGTPAATRQTLLSPLHTRSRRQALLITTLRCRCLLCALVKQNPSRQDTGRVQSSAHEDAQQHVSSVLFEVGPASPQLPSLNLICRSWRPIVLEASLAPAWLAASSQKSDAINEPCPICKRERGARPRHHK